MNNEEVKQWLRTQINSCIINPSKDIDNRYYLYYKKSYLRALKLSTIIGKPVNKENFKGGVKIFFIDIVDKEIYCYNKIENYLVDNYSKIYTVQRKIMEEVLNEYEEYKDYKAW